MRPERRICFLQWDIIRYLLSIHTRLGSRENREEAEALVTWLTHNYTLLIAEYQQDIDAGKMESKDVIGIITPFKGQAL